MFNNDTKEAKNIQTSYQSVRSFQISGNSITSICRRLRGRSVLRPAGKGQSTAWGCGMRLTAGNWARTLRLLLDVAE